MAALEALEALAALAALAALVAAIPVGDPRCELGGRRLGCQRDQF